MASPSPGAFDRANLWEGSDGHIVFVKLYNFIIGVMEHKVLDAAFPFKLEQLHEVMETRREVHSTPSW